MLANMIQPDWWIRQKALEEGMIEPFADRQVRSAEGGGGIISYGVSSFGYDLRAAREWKIFVNAFNTVVDPKNFDPQSFIDFDGDEVIIPPNSFVLARSVEYMRIPENVMVVALGKSSYARCFAGNTRVALVDGSSPTLEEMAKRAELGEVFFGYSLNEYGRIVVSMLESPRFIGRDALLEITLDNGEVIKATPDHKFITRDGRAVMADELRPNDALMPLYRDRKFSETLIYQPKKGYFYPEIPQTSNPVSAYQYLNHRVVSVRTLPGEHDVYCLTVPEAGNFALEAGVFVHNCGIVANVTPLEPGWEGHVTLEFSNTTPLPAKMYAGEGCVQLLFFEGQRPEVTYKDRKGKYQGQTGVTLPRL
jgi:deoxycytidine triphosphate deaminase